MSAAFRIILALALVAGIACAPAASPASPSDTSGATDEVAGASPAAARTEAPNEAPSATTPEDRVGNSWATLFDLDNNALRSYQLEVSGTSPSWDKKARAAETERYTYKIETSGKDRHYTRTYAKGSAPAETTEGYLMNDGEAAYTVVGGKVEPSLGFEMLEIAFLPLAIGLPIAFASTGTSAAGQDRVDGRLADKFSLDSAKAPAGVAGALNLFLTFKSAKGTVWVDKQTGALLKAVIEYRQDFVDPPGSGTVVGEGGGRFELSVSRVGSVKVSAPK